MSTEKMSNDAELLALYKGVISGSISLPKDRPKCCGQEMSAAGGVLGMRPDGRIVAIEHLWRCAVCKSEVAGLLS